MLILRTEKDRRHISTILWWISIYLYKSGVYSGHNYVIVAPVIVMVLVVIMVIAGVTHSGPKVDSPAVFHS